MEHLAGLPAIPAHGGWSLLFDAEAAGTTTPDLSAALLEHKVAATPTTAGGRQRAPRQVRFVYSNEPVERLTALGERVRAASAKPSSPGAPCGIAALPASGTAIDGHRSRSDVLTGIMRAQRAWTVSGSRHCRCPAGVAVHAELAVGLSRGVDVACCIGLAQSASGTTRPSLAFVAIVLTIPVAARLRGRMLAAEARAGLDA